MIERAATIADCCAFAGMYSTERVMATMGRATSNRLVCADNGDQLLLIGTDGVWIYILPTPAIERHRIAFGRWSRKHFAEWRGKRVYVTHRMAECHAKWCAWLGVEIPDELPAVVRL